MSLVSRFFLLTLCTITLAPVTAVRADIIQIPGITFVNRGDSSKPIGFNTGGTLSGNPGTYYAPVPFPADDQLVCKFTLVHRDRGSTITARLMKKSIVIDADPFSTPVEMAAILPSP